MASYDNKGQEDNELEEKELKERANRIRAQMGVIGKLYNIVVHVRALANRTEEIRKHIGRTIPLDNRMRWNSWFYMLQVSLNDGVRPGLQQYIEKYHKEGLIDRRDLLSTED